MISRRRFIRGLGGAGFLTIGGALAACDRMPETAIAPWRGPGADALDPRQRMLSWAILAPNPHNRQPWLVDLRKPGEILLYCDRDRLLAMTDPMSRQILIGHGTFLELLDIAASAEGYRLDIRLFPEGEFDDRTIDGRPIARIAVLPDRNRPRDPLFDAIPKRRSTKTPYDKRVPAADDVAKLGRAAPASSIRFGASGEDKTVGEIAAVAEEAFRIEYRTPRTLKESIDLLRIGADEIARAPDGLVMHGADVWWARLLGIVDRDKIMAPGTIAHDLGLKAQLALFPATPSWGWLASADNSRKAQIETGRAYARIDLAAAAAGIAIHPTSQALQEYAEMADAFARIHALLGVGAPGRVQMLFRLGFAERQGPTPRRSPSSLVLG